MQKHVTKQFLWTLTQSKTTNVLELSTSPPHPLIVLMKYLNTPETAGIFDSINFVSYIILNVLTTFYLLAIYLQIMACQKSLSTKFDLEITGCKNQYSICLLTAIIQHGLTDQLIVKTQR